MWENHTPPCRLFPIRGRVLVPLARITCLAILKEQHVYRLSIIGHRPPGVAENIQKLRLLLEISENLISLRLTGVLLY